MKHNFSVMMTMEKKKFSHLWIELYKDYKTLKNKIAMNTTGKEQNTPCTSTVIAGKLLLSKL